MALLAQLSDTHLSGSRPYFQLNFDIVIESLVEKKPELIVVTGDLALNGADDPDDLRFVRRQLDRLPAPWLALPGNHDIGLVPFEGGVNQPFNEHRRDTYLGHFDDDRFATDFAGWRVIGLNSQLLGSGLAAEEEQYEWLTHELAAGGDKSAIFLHYPIFTTTPDDTAMSHAAVVPEARRRLMSIIEAAGTTKLIASGHLHRERRFDIGGIVYQWAPATAFISSEDHEGHGGEAYNGYLLYDLADDSFTVERVEPHWIINHDIRNWARTKPHGYYDMVRRPFALPTHSKVSEPA